MPAHSSVTVYVHPSTDDLTVVLQTTQHTADAYYPSVCFVGGDVTLIFSTSIDAARWLEQAARMMRTELESYRIGLGPSQTSLEHADA